MIEARVVAIEPHPEQTTHHPGCWAVQFSVTPAGETRTFWRWHTVHRLNQNGAYVDPGNDPPTADAVLANFWSDVFNDLYGFNFDTTLFQKETP